MRNRGDSPKDASESSKGVPEIGSLVETKFEMGSVALRQWDRTGGFADLGR